MEDKWNSYEDRIVPEGVYTNRHYKKYQEVQRKIATDRKLEMRNEQCEEGKYGSEKRKNEGLKKNSKKEGKREGRQEGGGIRVEGIDNTLTVSNSSLHQSFIRRYMCTETKGEESMN